MLAAVCLLLLVSTFLAFRPALDKDFSFVNLDDNRYVYDNAHVTQGLTGTRSPGPSRAWNTTTGIR